HAALLFWGLVGFSARPLEAAPTEGLPVDIISDKQFSELTKGQKEAKVEAPKPLADKIGDPLPFLVNEPTTTEKKEIKTTTTEQQQPPPQPEAKPQEAKPEKKPPPKVDPIAEALKKEEAKKAAEAKKKAAQQKQLPPQPKFNPGEIAALLDKREAQRQAAAGDE